MKTNELTRAKSDRELVYVWLGDKSRTTRVSYRSIMTGFFDFINKPYNKGEIIKAIEKVKLNKEVEQLQMHLIIQDRLAALGLAIANIGHEIANPLTNLFFLSKKRFVAIPFGLSLPKYFSLR